jgi:alkanesulfonate monooxygenase SsuD/methylene tetrahydromethanopterin reductase-like flavin-dependent oxidoreductase (luciferase family)
MKVDYYFPPGPPAGASAAAVRALGLGFDGFFTAETGHEPFIPLALASQVAPSLDLGTAIAVAFPRSPMVTAQAAWDLAALSAGRFTLGLGTQVKAHVTRRFSTDWTSPGPRLARLRPGVAGHLGVLSRPVGRCRSRASTTASRS